MRQVGHLPECIFPYITQTFFDRVFSYTFSAVLIKFSCTSVTYSKFVPLKAKDVLIAKGKDVNIRKEGRHGIKEQDEGTEEMITC